MTTSCSYVSTYEQLPLIVAARFGRGWLEDRDGHLILHTYGSPHERGLQHGTLLADRIRACFSQVYQDGWFRGSPLLPPLVWYAYAYVNARFLTKDERAELRGVADGSGLRYADILVMNSAHIVDAVHNLASGGRVATTACTQIVLREPATAQNHTLVGRNLDMVGLDRVHQYAVIQVQHPDNGYAFITPGFAGKVLDAPTGWNEKGLVVSQDVAELVFENFCGVYSGAFIRRLVLSCATASEADHMVSALRNLGGGGRTITIACKSGANIIEVAQSILGGLFGCKRVATRSFGQCGDAPAIIVVNNHFRTPTQVARARVPSRSTQARQRRAQDLLASAYGKIGVDEVKDFLTDKIDPYTGTLHGLENPSDNIINWYGPRMRRFGPFAVPPQIDAHVATTISTVSDLGSGVMWIAQGKPYVDSATDYYPIRVYDELMK